MEWISRNIDSGNGSILTVYNKGTEGPVVFLLHGGGCTSFSFGLLINLLWKYSQCYAIDFRGHGESHSNDDHDLSATTMIKDIVGVTNAIVSMDNLKDQSIIFIGHSVGGAIAVRVVASALLSFKANGIVVLDVVEGTALEAIEYMDEVLRRRPASFLSYEDAINWSLKSGNLRNRLSAEISIPPQLRELSESEKKEFSDGAKYVFRTDLFASKPFWREWYEGLSELFLNETPKARLLILAGTDRLDDLLCGGHMAGKYQLVVCQGSGHAIMEDIPDELCRIIIQFFIRNNFISSVHLKGTGILTLEEKLERAKLLIPS